MPHELEVLPFSADVAHLVQNFDCGPSIWAQAASRWIANGLEAVQRGNGVWLYLDGSEVVGFGSLGKTSWPDPPPTREYAYIPQLAVASKFQGGPPPPSQKYSHQIMVDLIARALLLGPDELALRVHEDNDAGIRLYTRFDFAQFPRRARDGNYIRMVRELR